MSKGLATELGQLVERFAQEPKAIESDSLDRVADQLAKCFGVQTDEVAVLVLSHGGKILKFLIPEKFQTVGTIPVTSIASLAARTAREKRAELANNFTTARHASVFEGIPLGGRSGEQIHKIMSAPILDGNKTVGVVQISRKGQTVNDAGPDFTQQDLRELISITEVLGRFIKLYQAP